MHMDWTLHFTTLIAIDTIGLIIKPISYWHAVQTAHIISITSLFRNSDPTFEKSWLGWKSTPKHDYFCRYSLLAGITQGTRWLSELERWTGDRVVKSSNPAAATYSLQNFGNCVYPTLPVSFGGDTKSRRSLLSGVCARGSKRSHQSALEMCNLSWTPSPTYRDHTSSWTTLELFRVLSCEHDVFQIISPVNVVRWPLVGTNVHKMVIFRLNHLVMWSERLKCIVGSALSAVHADFSYPGTTSYSGALILLSSRFSFLK